MASQHDEQQQKQNQKPPPLANATSTTTTTISSTTSSSRRQIHHNHLRPNTELTEEERAEKRKLKKLLRRQTRRRSLVIRLQQAVARHDTPVETKTRKELEEFMKLEEQFELKTQPVLRNGPSTCVAVAVGALVEQEQTNGSNTSTNSRASMLLSEESQQSRHQEAQARFEIEALYQRFYTTLKKQQPQQEEQVKQQQPQTQASKKTKLKATDTTATSTPTTTTTTTATLTKAEQTAEARLLLKNMTQGTQTTCMFENHTALMGYLRQKWQERACLAISSLAKLDVHRWQMAVSSSGSNDNGGTTIVEQSSTDHVAAAATNEVKQRMWHRLTSNNDNNNSIRSICSIGCGPGCDAAGLIKFLEKFTAWNPTMNTTTLTLLDRVIFLDWTMDKWDFFLRPLQTILQGHQFIQSADLGHCDVLQSLSAESNAIARKLLLQNNKDNSERCDVDLFVTSYLLTETRGKWYDFYRDVIQMAKPGALFLFAEPKAWQLHTLIQQKKELMDFVWLDSSMHSPMLQALEGRVGPAVLLGMKR